MRLTYGQTLAICAISTLVIEGNLSAVGVDLWPIYCSMCGEDGPGIEEHQFADLCVTAKRAIEAIHQSVV